MRRMVTVVPQLTGNATLRYVEVSLPFVASLIDGKKYMCSSLLDEIGDGGLCEERYWIVACTVITDVPEAVGPLPVALMAKVSLPLYRAFAVYS